MVTFPKFEDFTNTEQEFIRDCLTSVNRFQKNLKNIKEEDFLAAFGEPEGKQLWDEFQCSKMDITSFGKQYFSEQQKKDMVAHLKTHQS